MNLGDEAQVKRRDSAVKRKEESYTEDLRNVLNHASGRRVLWKILDDCGVLRNCFVEHSSRLTDFLLGQKNLGLKLLAEIYEVNPDAYLRMKKENESVEQEGDKDV
jgi:hypothetical protein